MCITVVGLLVGFEAVGLTIWLSWTKFKAIRASPTRVFSKGHEGSFDRRSREGTDCFAIGEHEYNDEACSEGVQDEEAEPMLELTGKDVASRTP